MSDFKTPALVPIKAVPGLFIADVFAASSRQQLQEHNIVRIVSVLRRHETSRSLNARLAYIDIDTEADRDEAGHPTARPGPEIKVLDLDDDPLVDILEWLGETCDWIQEGLDAKVNVQKMSDRAAEGVRPGVLVHCKLGISRSGAFIVGFLMRRFQLSYASALSLARESRPQITPNSGFERQLRVWEFCGYSVYDGSESERPEAEMKEKPPYKAWKAERDNLLGRGEEDVNRARFSSLADMAARFGRRRHEEREAEGLAEADVEKSGSGSGSGKNNNVQNNDELETSLSEDKRREAWERVQKMENEWNERLIRGQVQGQVQGQSQSQGQGQGQDQVGGEHNEGTQR